MNGVMSTSSAAMPAHWAGCGAHTNVYCCNRVMASIIAAGPLRVPLMYVVVRSSGTGKITARALA